MSAQPAIDALTAWRDACPPSVRPQVESLLATTIGVSDSTLVLQVNARAATHGHRAVKTAWTDVADPARMSGAIFSTVGSCDTHLHSNPSGAFIELEPTRGSAKVSAQIPLSDVMLYDGQSLQDYALETLGITQIPRTATVKVKACLVYHEHAEVMLRTRSYHGVRMTTYAFSPGGSWGTVGIREGDGLLGMGHPDGQMKAFDFRSAESRDSDSDYKLACPALFGPRGSSITTDSDGIIMIVTLFRKADPAVHCSDSFIPAPVYRSLGAARVTASETNIGAAVAKPDLVGDKLDGVVIEIFRCMAIGGRAASDADTDGMCRGNLRMQMDIGGNDVDSKEKRAAQAALDALDGLSHCSAGHGPAPHGSVCHECGALVVCH